MTKAVFSLKNCTDQARRTWSVINCLNTMLAECDTISADGKKTGRTLLLHIEQLQTILEQTKCSGMTTSPP